MIIALRRYSVPFFFEYAAQAGSFLLYNGVP